MVPAGLALDGEDHFSILEQLANPDGILVKAIAALRGIDGLSEIQRKVGLRGAMIP